MTADPPTTRLGLYKSDPDGDDLVNYAQDLGANLDALDLAAGFLACTSTTRPSSPYNGKAIRETDTGRCYVWTGSAWTEITTPDTAQTFTGAFAVSGNSMVVERTSETTNAYRARKTGDANSRFLVNADGSILWGTGAAAGDTNLYRSAANTLKTDDSLIVAGDLTVTGVGSRTFLRKTADTAKTSSAMSDDPDLTMSVVSGRIYEVSGILFVLTTDETNGDFAVAWTVPASVGGYMVTWGQATTATTPAGSALQVTTNFAVGTIQNYGARTSATSPLAIVFKGILLPTANGTFALNWARTTSGTVTLLAQSHMSVTRVA